MKILRFGLLAILFGLALFSQTKTKTDQIKAPTYTDIKLLGIVNGRIVFFTVGQGITIENGVISASVGSGAEFKLTRQTDGTWGPISCAAFSVYRNGLRQYKVIDYTVIANSLRFVDGTTDPSAVDDVVIIECK